MNIFRKIKDYDRLQSELEVSERQNNQLRIDNQALGDRAKMLERERMEMEGMYMKAEDERRRLASDCAVLSADKPEKKKYYTLYLQKALMPYIWEEGDKIFIKVCKAPEK